MNPGQKKSNYCEKKKRRNKNMSKENFTVPVDLIVKLKESKKTG